MSALDKQEGGNHYKDMPIQPITFITKNKLDWYQGNIVKYATRHHNKGGADDLRKVIHYAELALEAQYGIQAAEQKAKPENPNDDWVEWNGGACPVEDGRAVGIRFRDGSEFLVTAGGYDWRHKGGDSDIVAYRIPKS